ncbi:BrnT family toxin [Roseofilum capinflatum]|uniref:BrnT family toxin n=1 Tax=Roseofilum capinflatum BLCC-M114 TaxID=3022440 RepID=A0ABT7BAU8_9CYAN|nr:BrnT family toxin [Roseofilum capinflatum]MDJ1175729.1 BrnT family toxin [Roseofilum capinflatum BLCC-M114]
MNVVYRLQGVEFEWDANKAQVNFEKHGVTFEEAAEAFFDPFYQTGDATVNSEQREFILGYSLAYRVLFVVYIASLNELCNWKCPLPISLSHGRGTFPLLLWEKGVGG